MAPYVPRIHGVRLSQFRVSLSRQSGSGDAPHLCNPSLRRDDRGIRRSCAISLRDLGNTTRSHPPRQLVGYGAFQPLDHVCLFRGGHNRYERRAKRAISTFQSRAVRLRHHAVSLSDGVRTARSSFLVCGGSDLRIRFLPRGTRSPSSVGRSRSPPCRSTVAKSAAPTTAAFSVQFLEYHFVCNVRRCAPS